MLKTYIQKGDVVAAITVSDDDGLLITTKEGVMMHIAASDVRVQGRATQGVRIMDVKPTDEISDVARVD